jgi:3-deoxy-D-manno-octulosonic-acid transferase
MIKLTIYRIFSVLLLPIILIYLLYRLSFAKESQDSRFFERLACTRLKPNHKKKIIWFHAASVGESLSIIPLINHFAQDPKCQILVTSGTVTSAKLLAKKLPLNSIHQYIPIDSLFIVKKFLRHWQPNLAIWTESELWPNLIYETAKKCKILLINARISEKSCNKWLQNLDIATVILSSFTEIIAQSDIDYKRFKTLPVNNISKIGNLKYCAPAFNIQDNKEDIKLEKSKDKTIIMLASSHDDEEYNIAQIYQLLIEKYSNLFLIISPRHPHRSSHIIKKLEKIIETSSISVRSKKQQITNETKIYLADTIGEYGIFYNISNIVIIGGSFIKHGGQNLLEPAKLSNSIICGPYMYNFDEITNYLLENNAILQADNYTDLYNKICMLLDNHQLQEKLIKNSLACTQSSEKILLAYIKTISEYIIY